VTEISEIIPSESPNDDSTLIIIVSVIVAVVVVLILVVLMVLVVRYYKLKSKEGVDATLELEVRNLREN
jgi:heme/copper-type cytochrome/quinol oxidase subunit 2